MNQYHTRPSRKKDVVSRPAGLGLIFASIALSALLALPAAAMALPPLQSTGSPTPDLLTEYQETVTHRGLTGEGIDVEITLVDPGFMAAAGRSQEAAELGADTYLVFVAVRRHHGALDDAHAEHEHWGPILKIDGKDIRVPSETRFLGDDGHNRTNAFIFEDVPASMLLEDHSYELLLPAGDDGVRPSMIWFSPLIPAELLATPVASPDPGA